MDFLLHTFIEHAQAEMNCPKIQTPSIWRITNFQPLNHKSDFGEGGPAMSSHFQDIFCLH
jgi:hypothetical protein